MKYTELCQNRSWWSKSKYYDYDYDRTDHDQSETLVCPLQIQYHIHHASRPYPGWLNKFRRLLQYFIMFYWPKYTELCQNWSWLSKSKYYCQYLISEILNWWSNLDPNIIINIALTHTNMHVNTITNTRVSLSPPPSSSPSPSPAD